MYTASLIKKLIRSVIVLNFYTLETIICNVIYEQQISKSMYRNTHDLVIISFESLL